MQINKYRKYLNSCNPNWIMNQSACSRSIGLINTEIKVNLLHMNVININNINLKYLTLRSTKRERESY